jgi:hypothetical protein
MHLRLWRVLFVALLLSSACGEPNLPPFVPRDGGRIEDGGTVADGGRADGGSGIDGGQADGGPGTDGGATADGGAADGGPSCDTRTVAPPTHCANADFPAQAQEDWNHPLAAGFVTLQGSARHRCIDLIVNPGQPQTLIGKFAYGPFDDDLKDEKVELWIRRPVQSQCTWQKLGDFMTSEDGEFGSQFGVEDDGGRAFFVLADAERLPLGLYPVKMLVKGDLSEANCRLVVWPRGVHVVVADIDGTITTQENDGLWSALDPNSPTPHASSPEVLHAYVSKNYRLIYLTARPEFLTKGTEKWFRDKGFPDGVFHLSQSNFGETGNAAISYKGDYLAGLKSNQGVIFDWAYGNKDTDLAAYKDRAAIDPSRIRMVLYDGDLMGSIRIDSYTIELDRVNCLPPVVQP